MAKLTKADIEKLLADPSVKQRAETAAMVAGEFSDQHFDASERKLAAEIFRIMVHDAGVRVREALSAHLKESPDIPHDIAMSLANDVDSVALPIIEFSEVLTDNDLVEIINASGELKQSAVARRETLSTDVTKALVETENETVIATMMDNDGAEISEDSFQTVLEKFSDSDAIKTPMALRSVLPIDVSERLVTLVSDNLREHLLTKKELDEEATADLILGIRERATLGLLLPGTEAEDMEKLVGQLEENDRLTPSIILRALCAGNLTFFESAMAHCSNIPIANVRILVHDSGYLGLVALFDKTSLPKEMLPAIRVAIDVARETGYDGGDHDRERYVRRMIERFLTQFEDIGAENLEYLLTKLSKFSPVKTLKPN
ncbi:MAG: DUF2336 domain-containing protein [Alphaproteobacteria bacterium]